MVDVVDVDIFVGMYVYVYMDRLIVGVVNNNNND